MKHFMKLQEKYFNKVKSKEKTVELRMFDEKRRKIKVGDSIEFSNTKDPHQTATLKVRGLLYYRNFKELIDDTPASYLGLTEEDKPSLVQTMYEIYSKEDEEKWGVVGIRLE